MPTPERLEPISNEVSGGIQLAPVLQGPFHGSVSIGGQPGTTVAPYVKDPERWPVTNDWDAILSGVHRARPDAEGAVVPTYVERDADRRLRTRLAAVARTGGLLLLIGDSTAGKTRSAFEAVRQVLPGYRILAPDTNAELACGVEIIAGLGQSCLVWLDDLDRFLGEEGLEPGLLAELVRLRIPVLATMQSRVFNTLTLQAGRGSTAQGNPLAHHRNTVGLRVLNQAETVEMERLWSREEIGRAKHCRDERVRSASRYHGSYGIAEYLTAGPELWREWRQASCVGGAPRGASLVAAAVDLARTGLKGPYPHKLVIGLHEAYLTATGGLRLHPEPLESAVSWATQVRHGVTGLLMPGPGETWSVFDYLAGTARSESALPSVPIATWNAALRAEGADPLHIGMHAFHDDLFDVAEAALRPLIEESLDAALNLATILTRTGRPEEAEVLCRRTAEGGQAAAWCRLAALLHPQEDREEEAEDAYRRAIEGGHGHANRGLGDLLAEVNRDDGAEVAYTEALAAGVDEAWCGLGDILARAGRREESNTAFRNAAESPNPAVWCRLGSSLTKAGRTEEAMKLFQRSHEAGHSHAQTEMGDLLTELGRADEAESAYLSAHGKGEAAAACRLGDLLMDAGRNVEAKASYRKALDDGHVHAGCRLGELLSQGGLTKEAEAAYRQSFEGGHAHAGERLRFLLGQAGRYKEAAAVRYRRRRPGSGNSHGRKKKR
ncbi:tetratricopeptide (TPR) repeat protein [Streptacidiphilus sp. EB129]